MTQAAIPLSVNSFAETSRSLQLLARMIGLVSPATPISAAKFILQQPYASLVNAQALSALGTGILKNTTGTGMLSIALLGTDYGDVVGPSSATDNAIVRFDGATGKLIQDTTGCSIDDSGFLTAVLLIADRTSAFDSLTPCMNLRARRSGGGAGASFGISNHWILDNSANSQITAVRMRTEWIAATAGAEFADLFIDVVVNGTLTSVAQFLNRTLKIIDSSTYPPLNITARSTAPTTPATHDVYLDDGTNTSTGAPGFKRWNGSAWVNFSIDATLAALAVLDATAGLLVQTGADTFVRRTLQAPAAGFTIANPAGTAGDPTFSLANDLAALEGMSGTGIVARTASETYAQRTIAAGAGGSIIVADGDGVAANPTITRGALTGDVLADPDDQATTIADGVVTAAKMDSGAATDGQVLTADGLGNAAWEDASGGSGTPGGSDTQIQYNNAGAFGGIAPFTWDGTNLLIATTTPLRFRDSATNIDSPSANVLRLTAPQFHLLGNIIVADNAGTHNVFIIADVASAVNYLRVLPNTTGNAPQLEALGSDANVNLNLVSQGTSFVTANGLRVVRGPTSSTDNGVTRWDGTDGSKVQNSGVTIDDSNQMLFPTTARCQFRDSALYVGSSADGQLDIVADVLVAIGAAGDGIVGTATESWFYAHTAGNTHLGKAGNEFGDIFSTGTLSCAAINVADAPLGYTITAYAAGTAYSMTASAALLNFGTTDPQIVVDAPGTYIITARVQLKYNAATFAANRTTTVKLRRTNNTAADLTNGTVTATTRIITTVTDTFVDQCWQVVYTTANSNDAIELQGLIDVVPTAGSLDAVAASIVALRIA